MAGDRIDRIVQRVRAQSSPEGAAWLTEAVAAAREGDVDALRRAFPVVSRRTGTGPFDPGEAAAALQVDGFQVPLAMDEAARLALLLAAAEGVGAEPFESLVRGVYGDGDTRERMAVLRALALLPEPERFAPIGLDAGRTNDAGLFRAIACDNPFPARCYGDAELNRLVMKAVFMEVPLEGIVGLARRANPELARMAMERIDEQLSAGRSYPAAIWLAIAPCAPPGAVARMLGELEHSARERRAWAARGLGMAGDPRALSFLTERRSREQDETVHQAVEAALGALQSTTGPA
jgi:hypothetical protein